jgi:voltage-gated potassium channel
LWTANFLYPEDNFLKSRFKYIFSFFAIVDILAILPFYLPLILPSYLISLRSFRLIKLFQLLKLTRHTDALLNIVIVLKNKSYHLISSFIVVLFIIFLASIVMYNIEYDAQPQVFNNAFSSLWWAVATVTTVGYGDIYPITVTGKILSSVLSFLGIALVAIPTGMLSAGFNELTEKKNEVNYKFCPYCGNKLN